MRKAQKPISPPMIMLSRRRLLWIIDRTLFMPGMEAVKRRHQIKHSVIRYYILNTPVIRVWIPLSAPRCRPISVVRLATCIRDQISQHLKARIRNASETVTSKAIIFPRLCQLDGRVPLLASALIVRYNTIGIIESSSRRFAFL